MLAPLPLTLTLGATPATPAARPVLITVDDLPIAAASLHPFEQPFVQGQPVSEEYP